MVNVWTTADNIRATIGSRSWNPHRPPVFESANAGELSTPSHMIEEGRQTFGRSTTPAHPLLREVFLFRGRVATPLLCSLWPPERRFRNRFVCLPNVGVTAIGRVVLLAPPVAAASGTTRLSSVTPTSGRNVNRLRQRHLPVGRRERRRGAQTRPLRTKTPRRGGYPGVLSTPMRGEGPRFDSTYAILAPLA